VIPKPLGETTAKIQLGNDRTKPGTKFTVVAMTTERPLSGQTYLNLPDYRTISDEITLVRASFCPNLEVEQPADAGRRSSEQIEVSRPGRAERALTRG
jgi:hypothetical protein